MPQLLRSAGVENASLEQETDDDWSLAFDDLLILYADTVVPITAGKQSDPYTELIEAVFRQLDSVTHHTFQLSLKPGTEGTVDGVACMQRFVSKWVKGCTGTRTSTVPAYCTCSLGKPRLPRVLTVNRHWHAAA